MLSLPSFGPMGLRPSRNFDPHTGQVFVEVVVPAGRASSRSTVSRLANVRRSRTRSPGPSSLSRLAMAEMVRQSFDLSVEHIAALPDHKRQEYWAKAKELPDTQLAAWKLMAEHDAKETDCAYLHQSSVEHDSAHANDLEAWLPKLDCGPRWSESLHRNTFPWLTALTINNVDCSRQELINLHKLRNLVALDICGKRRQLELPEGVVNAYGRNNGFVDERLLWHWANRAFHDGAFAQLRVLIIRNEPAITKSIAPFLVGFPALKLFGVQDCGVYPLTDIQTFLDSQTSCNPSFRSLNSPYEDLNHKIALESGWDGVLRLCVERTAADDEASGLCTKESSDDAPGILNFRMGQTPSGTIFSKNIVFFHNHPKPLGALDGQSTVERDWVFVPQGHRLPGGFDLAHAGCMAPPPAPLIFTGPVQPTIRRSRAKVDLNDFFAETGISSAPSAAIHGDCDMQRSTSIGEPASAFHHFQSDKGATAESDAETLSGTKSPRKRVYDMEGVADGIASAPGTPPRRAHEHRMAKTIKKSKPIDIPTRPSSNRKQSVITDFTDNVDAGDFHTLFKESA